MIGIISVLMLTVFIIIFFFVAERIFESTNYYKINYGEADKLKETGKVNYVNTGSTFAYYGLDYDACGVKGLNLAMCPQSLEYDFKMLKHYEHRYHKGTTVFIVISDLAFAKKKYTEEKINERYYKILNRKEMDNYSFFKSIRAKYLPVLYSWKNFLRFHWDIGLEQEYELSVNENDKEAVEADAYKRSLSWIEEFNLTNLQDGIQGDRYYEEFSYTVEIVKNMIAWCKERGHRPVLINLPVSEELKSNFSQKFLDSFYYDNVRRALGEDIVFIDFQKNEKLSDYLLYLDSCRLNKAGREIVTRLLLNEVNNIA